MKAGRNTPCSCGSGRKYKLCCGEKSSQKRFCENSALGWGSHLRLSCRTGVRLIAGWYGRNTRLPAAGKSLVRGAWALA